jgi:hypothetical protein
MQQSSRFNAKALVYSSIFLAPHINPIFIIKHIIDFFILCGDLPESPDRFYVAVAGLAHSMV